MNERTDSDVIIIAMDIASSSDQEGRRQGERYGALQKIFAQACEEVRLSIQPGDQGDRGDGDIIIVRTDFELARVVADLPREFAGVLDQYNRQRSSAAQLRVRMAVHRGPVWGQPGHWDGHAVVDACRLLDASATRELLAGQSIASLALCISMAVYDVTVRENLRNLERADWTPFTVTDREKGAGLHGWTRALGQISAPKSAPTSPPSPNHSDAARYNVWTSGSGSPAIGHVTGPVTGQQNG